MIPKRMTQKLKIPEAFSEGILFDSIVVFIQLETALSNVLNSYISQQSFNIN